MRARSATQRDERVWSQVCARRRVDVCVYTIKILLGVAHAVMADVSRPAVEDYGTRKTMTNKQKHVVGLPPLYLYAKTLHARGPWRPSRRCR